jgi:hypothetical protein
VGVWNRGGGNYSITLLVLAHSREALYLNFTISSTLTISILVRNQRTSNVNSTTSLLSKRIDRTFAVSSSYKVWNCLIEGKSTCLVEQPERYLQTKYNTGKHCLLHYPSARG